MRLRSSARSMTRLIPRACIVPAVVACAIAACDKSPVSSVPVRTPSVTADKGGNGSLPDRYVIPGNTVFPEGLAYDPRTQTVYVSSTTDGTIFHGNASDDALTPFLPGGADGRTTAIGLEVDSKGRLYVAGGGTGFVFIYDGTTGQLLAKLSGGSSPTFINDIAIGADDVAYATDSQSPVIYRIVPNGTGGFKLERWLELPGTPIVYVAGFNLNGMDATGDGRFLFTVQTNTGKVFRINTETKEIVPVDIGGATFPNGDGVWMRGNTFFILQNSRAIINEVRLQPEQATGTLVSQTTDPSLHVPTSLVGARGRMLLVNSQFDKRGPGLVPSLPFTVSVLAIP
jgi:DNA-binding beta-propeller fold protein YncE